MATYHLTDDDKTVSFRKLCTRLYFANHTTALDATNAELAAALRAIADSNDIAVLQRTVGADGVWAARYILEHTNDAEI